MSLSLFSKGDVFQIANNAHNYALYVYGAAIYYAFVIERNFPHTSNDTSYYIT